jgi:hypothetical protein
MKKILVSILLAVFFVSCLNAQEEIVDSVKAINVTHKEHVAKPKKQYNLTNRTNDHLMLQIGYTNWAGTPDSIKVKGFSRSLNAYFMFDFPFKTTPKLSAAVGLGFGTDHIIFKKDNHPDVKGATNTMRFNGPDTALFKKTKLMTAYLEAPIELRYLSDPEHSDKSFKAAIGVKVGALLKSGTRSRALANYVEKESGKKYFNSYRIAGTARIGWGVISLFGTYQFTPILKDAAGPALRPFTVGLTLSGL